MDTTNKKWSGRQAVVVDTNILLDYLGSIKELGINHPNLVIYITHTVTKELDHLKSKCDAGFRAREAARWLEDALSGEQEHVVVQNRTEEKIALDRFLSKQHFHTIRLKFAGLRRRW